MAGAATDYLPVCKCPDVCPIHSPGHRQRTVSKALRAYRAGKLSRRQYEHVKAACKKPPGANFGSM